MRVAEGRRPRRVGHQKELTRGLNLTRLKYRENGGAGSNPAAHNKGGSGMDADRTLIPIVEEDQGEGMMDPIDDPKEVRCYLREQEKALRQKIKAMKAQIP